ncbi:hypothetical protein Z947_2310 [Sulfitobacter geojensis]|nr:hypothetical protein Z947_2310 [Sulfitobacter geojensis]
MHPISAIANNFMCCAAKGARTGQPPQNPVPLAPAFVKAVLTNS